MPLLPGAKCELLHKLPLHKLPSCLAMHAKTSAFPQKHTTSVYANMQINFSAHPLLLQLALLLGCLSDRKLNSNWIKPLLRHIPSTQIRFRYTQMYPSIRARLLPSHLPYFRCFIACGFGQFLSEF